MAVIDLICGSLGAGKTTYIKNYSRYIAQKGQTFAVIENEYGEAGVDSAFLLNDGIETSELSGGCICCTLKVGFHDELIRLAQTADRIIVEPSGIYDITTFFDVTASEELNVTAKRGAVICIIDPHSLDRLCECELKLLINQISAASCVVLSKTEEMSVSEIDRVKALILRITGMDEINFVDYNNFESASTGRSAGCDCAPESDHSSIFQSTRISVKEKLTANETLSACRRLFGSDCTGDIIRIKGFVPSENGYLAVNATKEHCEVFEVANALPALNIIGTNLSRKTIKKLISGGINNES